MFPEETKTAITHAAREAGLEPAALLAVAQVETGGRVSAVVSGRPEPLIRFEGHWFDRLLDDDRREAARAKGLASPDAGAVKNPASQEARWALLEDAIAIDRDAALQSVSWGVGQVMGLHWEALGYDSVEDLVAEARSGVGGQVRLMLRFLRANGLIEAVEAHDWAAFARGYNGPRYKVNRYDSRIAAAYERYRREDAGKAKASGALVRGDRGEAVQDLQHMLTAAGHPLTPDGRFGAATADAVERFQVGHQLDATGIADEATLAALRGALGGPPAPRSLVRSLSLAKRMLPTAIRLAGLRARLKD